MFKYETSLRDTGVKMEEVLRFFFFFSVAVFLVSHILFIPLEFLAFAFAHDPELKNLLTMLYVLYGSKYVSVLIMLYCAYHHRKLVKDEKPILWICCVVCLAVTSYFGWLVI